MNNPNALQNNNTSIVTGTASFYPDYFFYQKNNFSPSSNKLSVTSLPYYEDSGLEIGKEYYFSDMLFAQSLQKKFGNNVKVINHAMDNDVLSAKTIQIQDDFYIYINYCYYAKEQIDGINTYVSKYLSDVQSMYKSYRYEGIYEIYFYYSVESQKIMQDVIECLVSIGEEIYKPEPVKEEVVSKIGIICKDINRFFYIADKEFFQDGKMYYDFDLDIHYGNGFTENFHNLLIDRLNNRSNGIILFHGQPGTGKTFYIRRLIKDLYNNPKKKIIIVPNTFANDITSPEFFDFLRNYVQNTDLNLVLIMEDAENLLRKRSSRNSFDAVSNILNMTDGLLNDIISIQIIATFNTEVENIDPALLRNKRLLAKKELKRLTKEQAIQLAKYIKVPENEIQNMNELTYSAAEVYSLVEKEQDKKLIS